ncbi:uncharacterized protein [Rutidosis leptorrhynchoides]|uniref:uncharacterized protein n=1 Tax=Rutidosis leptorrhynchoides TaxID=125765 RepID=UPI003A9A1D01
MNSNEVEVDQNTKEQLIHLGFIEKIGLTFFVILSNVYTFAKENSGVLKTTIISAENAVVSSVMPVYEKLKGLPKQILAFVDDKFDKYAPSLAKKLFARVQSLTDKLFNITNSLPKKYPVLQAVNSAAQNIIKEAQIVGTKSALQAAYVSFKIVGIPVIAKFWYDVNTYPKLHALSKVLEPVAEYLSDWYNKGETSVEGSAETAEGLVELPLANRRYSWMNKTGTKMSLLDRFFVSQEVNLSIPDLSVEAFNRGWSDHIPLFLRVDRKDFGHIPFKVFNSWLYRDGFKDFVDTAWKEHDMNVGLFEKMKRLKRKIKAWVVANRLNDKSRLHLLKERINEIECKMENSCASLEELDERTKSFVEVEEISQLDDLDIQQKSRIKWDIEGDENSQFFHGLVNYQRKHNLIKGILIDGMWNSNPKEIKDHFFDFFANKFSSLQSDVLFPNLTPFSTLNRDDVVSLESEFTEQEIKMAVWSCGSQKTPGPDGFSFHFIKYFWEIMKADIISAVNNAINSRSLSKGATSSFITLIPKSTKPMHTNDFRPISLIGAFHKIIAKLLALRLAKVIDKIISPEQTAFIRGRQILDGPLILNEVIEWYKKNNKKMLLFKVDFEKAFDTVNWEFLNYMMMRLGFGSTWIAWIFMCLKSARSSVIINGSPTREFPILRGSRQGDPLSPFLFLIVMEGLNILLHEYVSSGLIQGARIANSEVIVSHLFYADDVMIVSEWNSLDMENIIRLFSLFHDISGLKINIDKSKVYGVGVMEVELGIMATQTGCMAGAFPLNYLGLPLGANMKLVKNWKVLEDRFVKKLSRWKGNLLSMGGRLTLIKSVLGSLGIYFFSLYKCPVGVLKKLESLRSRFFWGGGEEGRKMMWINWQQVLAPYSKGGLNVGSLKAFNLALLLKWRWRLLTDSKALWVKVIKVIHGDENSGAQIRHNRRGTWGSITSSWSDLHTQNIILNNVFKRKVGNGANTKFWKDIWIGDCSLASRFGRIFSLDMNGDCTIADRFINGVWVWDWSRELTSCRHQALLQDLKLVIDSFVLGDQMDSWACTISKQSCYLVKDGRMMIDNMLLPSNGHSTRWINTLPRKVNIFMWRVELNKLPSRLNLSKKGLEIMHIDCPSCGFSVESTEHVLFECPIASQVWSRVQLWTNADMPHFCSWNQGLAWLNNWNFTARVKDHMFIIMAAYLWIMWRYRNNVIFGENKMKKADLFDSICNFSFNWIRYRSKCNISKNDWLCKPFYLPLVPIDEMKAAYKLVKTTMDGLSACTFVCMCYVQG